MTDNLAPPLKRQRLNDDVDQENTPLKDQSTENEHNTSASVSIIAQSGEENIDNVEEQGEDAEAINEALVQETEKLFSAENLLKAYDQLDYLVQNKNAIKKQWEAFSQVSSGEKSGEIEVSEGVELSDQVFEESLAKAYEDILQFLDQFSYLLCSQHPETLESVCHWIITRGHDDDFTYNDLIKTLIGEKGAPWNFVDRNEVSLGDLLLQRNNIELYNWLVGQGVQVELILRALGKESKLPSTTITAKDEEIDHDAYLKQKLVFKDGVILDADGNGVMMGWERPLMEVHADILCSPWGAALESRTTINQEEGHDGNIDNQSHHESLPSLEEMGAPVEELEGPRDRYSVLNVGFGLGIIDELLQEYHPTKHVIIEAHPDVYAKMLEDGWDKKPGVQILFGKWQEFVNELKGFDAIFFDTYGENYDALAEFNAHLPVMLKKSGIYSFFNGLAARNILFHDVACQIAVSDLAALGISTQFITMEMEVDDKEWAETRDKYWKLKEYRVPVCTFGEIDLINEDELDGEYEGEGEDFQMLDGMGDILEQLNQQMEHEEDEDQEEIMEDEN